MEKLTNLVPMGEYLPANTIYYPNAKNVQKVLDYVAKNPNQGCIDVNNKVYLVPAEDLVTLTKKAADTYEMPSNSKLSWAKPKNVEKFFSKCLSKVTESETSLPKSSKRFVVLNKGDGQMAIYELVNKKFLKPIMNTCHRVVSNISQNTSGAPLTIRDLDLRNAFLELLNNRDSVFVKALKR